MFSFVRWFSLGQDQVHRWTHGRDGGESGMVPQTCQRTNSTKVIQLEKQEEQQRYCWWFRNPVTKPVEVGSFSHYLQGFIHPRWCRISEPSTVSLWSTQCQWEMKMIWRCRSGSSKLKMSCLPGDDKKLGRVVDPKYILFDNLKNTNLWCYTPTRLFPFLGSDFWSRFLVGDKIVAVSYQILRSLLVACQKQNMALQLAWRLDMLLHVCQEFKNLWSFLSVFFMSVLFMYYHVDLYISIHAYL